MGVNSAITICFKLIKRVQNCKPSVNNRFLPEGSSFKPYRFTAFHDNNLGRYSL